MAIASPAQALWQQRHQLARHAPRLRQLIEAVKRGVDFNPYQWAQIMACTLEFQPDLILELGRDYGNSTCCFLEAAELLHPSRSCRVVSRCFSDYWYTTTAPKLRALCSPSWFARGDIQQGDILAMDFAPLLEGRERVLLLWDAHGFEIAEHLLTRLMPLLATRAHLVLVHDMSDSRYELSTNEYDNNGLWKGERCVGGYYRLGHVQTCVAQAVSILDFTGRNHLEFHSAAESLHQELGSDPAKRQELECLLGNDLFSLQAHWFWFSLNEATGPLVFPPLSARLTEQQRLTRECQRLERELLQLRSSLTVRLREQLMRVPVLSQALRTLARARHVG